MHPTDAKILYVQFGIGGQILVFQVSTYLGGIFYSLEFKIVH
jgi:hypothetical protein